ncbi:MAG: hypothetical protein JWM59_3602 [Verrucomicrobiales bacterium]|nr:hypothetical protein [Verrucomicrobiales bacterium]
MGPQPLNQPFMGGIAAVSAAPVFSKRSAGVFGGLQDKRALGANTEFYTALPNEEGQPVSYVRRIVVEGSAAQALGLAGGFLRDGEAVAAVYGLPGLEPAAAKPEPKPAPAKPRKSV